MRLWQKYQLSQDGIADSLFIVDYKALLAAGGTARYDAALAKFDLDPRQPAFWSLGLDMISGMIDELERLA